MNFILDKLTIYSYKKKDSIALLDYDLKIENIENCTSKSNNFFFCLEKRKNQIKNIQQYEINFKESMLGVTVLNLEGEKNLENFENVKCKF